MKEVPHDNECSDILPHCPLREKDIQKTKRNYASQRHISTGEALISSRGTSTSAGVLCLHIHRSYSITGNNKKGNKREKKKKTMNTLENYVLHLLQALVTNDIPASALEICSGFSSARSYEEARGAHTF